MYKNTLRINSLLMPLLMMSMAHFLVDVMLGIWSVYKSFTHLNLMYAGLIAAVGAFLGEGSQLFFGRLSDKGHRKLLVILGLFLSVGNSTLMYTTELSILFVLFLLTCVGSGCFHPTAASLVGSLDSSRRGFFMGIFSFAGGLGLAGSQLLFFLCYDCFGGHTTVLMIPSILLGSILIFYPFPQQNLDRSGSSGQDWKEMFRFFKKAPFRSLYFLHVANQAILWGMIFILPEVLKVFGYPEWVTYGGGHLVLILGGALMSVPAGYLADIYSSRQVIVVSVFVAVLSFYAFLFFGGNSLIVLFGLLFILGSVLGLVTPVGVSLGISLQPESSGAVSAFLMGMVWCVAEALGAAGVGLLSSLFSDSYAPVKALALLGSLFVVQVAAALSLPQPERKKLEAITDA